MAHWLKKSIKKKKTGNNILSITYYRSMPYIFIKTEDYMYMYNYMLMDIYYFNDRISLFFVRIDLFLSTTFTNLFIPCIVY